jgi:hypothetical protein
MFSLVFAAGCASNKNVENEKQSVNNVENEKQTVLPVRENRPVSSGK